MIAVLNLDGHLEAVSIPAALHLGLRPCHMEGWEGGGLRLSISSSVNNPLPSKMYKLTNQKPNFLIGILKTVPRLKNWSTRGKHKTEEPWNTWILGFFGHGYWHHKNILETISNNKNKILTFIRLYLNWGAAVACTSPSFEKQLRIFPPLLTRKIWIYATFKLKLLLLI